MVIARSLPEGQSPSRRRRLTGYPAAVRCNLQFAGHLIHARYSIVLANGHPVGTRGAPLHAPSWGGAFRPSVHGADRPPERTSGTASSTPSARRSKCAARSRKCCLTAGVVAPPAKRRASAALRGAGVAG